jgi:hypothetical protein
MAGPIGCLRTRMAMDECSCCKLMACHLQRSLAAGSQSTEKPVEVRGWAVWLGLARVLPSIVVPDKLWGKCQLSEEGTSENERDTKSFRSLS